MDYVRDDVPFVRPDPPATLFRYSLDRSGDHPVEHLRVLGHRRHRTSAGYAHLIDVHLVETAEEVGSIIASFGLRDASPL